MKAFIHYVSGHGASEQQANESLNSFIRHGWDASLVEGVTPETLDDKEFDVKLAPKGRIVSMYERGDRVYLTKKSCLTNHYRLWNRCIELNETIAFIEQDAIAIGAPQKWFFDGVCVLNIEHAFRPPSVLGTLSHLKDYVVPAVLTPTPLPVDYRLKYYKDNKWKGNNMMPGTAAYAITPKGAKQLLTAAYDYGIDQSDFFINTGNVNINYITPSPVKFNTKNLNLSHKL